MHHFKRKHTSGPVFAWYSRLGLENVNIEGVRIYCTTYIETTCTYIILPVRICTDLTAVRYNSYISIVQLYKKIITSAIVINKFIF
jgi:hypothetical protein